jgi:hypothetical protein
MKSGADTVPLNAFNGGIDLVDAVRRAAARHSLLDGSLRQLYRSLGPISRNVRRRWMVARRDRAISGAR